MFKTMLQQKGRLRVAIMILAVGFATLSSPYYNVFHTRLLCFSYLLCQTKTSAGEITLSNISFTAHPQVSQFSLLSKAAQLDSQYLFIDTSTCYIMGIHN